jgi:hypothetical protein
MSRLGGWYHLAQRYSTHKPFAGKRWHMQSIGMRLSSNYNSIVTIGANDQGLFFSMLFLFAFGHQLLSIPWENITVTSKRWFFREAPCRGC